MTTELPTPTTRRARREPKVNINETFGPTIQGEGRMAGRLCSFLRTSGCNLACSWCDTPYTWDWDRFNKADESHPTTIPALVELTKDLPGRLVISGGEPLMQASGLAAFMHALREVKPSIEFDLETNGTRKLGLTEGLWSTISCSPKVISSAGQVGGPVDPRVIDPTIMEVADFKFVVRDAYDLHDVLDWLETTTITPDRVWLMPEGTDHATLTMRTPFVMNSAVEHGFNFSTRMHVYGWADARGH